MIEVEYTVITKRAVRGCERSVDLTRRAELELLQAPIHFKLLYKGQDGIWAELRGMKAGKYARICGGRKDKESKSDENKNSSYDDHARR
mmetsp:Transcript_42203/g.132946  ORF Transcript_42203/g.132946 Transcript_42203/m.132946 type:complete len:89 (+) Transcript_42203:868-1134(+)